jgi:lipid-binding SYLF domain-containing protein
MKAITIGLMSCLIMLAVCGCEVTPKEPEDKAVLVAEVDEAIAVMKAKDPSIQEFFDKSYGYAMLPKIFKGAFIAGGAYGRGEVYEQGTRIGYCNMKQGSLGASIGTEYYREIIFFEDKEDLEKFKYEDFTFSAQITAVALTWGKAAKTNYHSGMVVFIITDTGMMGDVSVGGQKFNFEPTYVLRKVQ